MKTSLAIKQYLELSKSSAFCYKDLDWFHRIHYMDENKRAVVDAFCPLRTIITSYSCVYRESFQNRTTGKLFFSVDCDVFIYDFNLNYLQVN